MLNLPTLKYLLLIGGFLLINNHSAVAQITPDNTLGAESSRVVPNGAIDKIDGGALRDRNLFHSFKEFNIKNGQSVYFNNPSGIENILTRVTGKNASNIFGTLGVDGAANLFLINPNGIVFGENARLDLGGSFVGSTASGLQFGEQGDFSATNPQAPGLLTVNPNALFFNQLQGNAGIINKSQASAGISPAGENATGLRVADSQSLLFVGGDIDINGGELKAYGGNIELAGLSAPGNIALEFFGNKPSLNVPDSIERADLSLSNEAAVNVRSNNGGNIKINARNVDLTEDSKLRAGIDKGLGTLDSQGGDIVINATGITTISSNSFIANIINEKGFGKTGDIIINTGSLNLSERGQINAGLFPLAAGDAGDIFIQAKDNISLISSDISGSVDEGAIGNASEININTDFLSLTEGSEINAKTSGQGNAGNITVNARQSISLDGSGDFILSDGSNGTIFTRIINSVNPDAVGNAGDIQLNTGTLSATNGAFISSDTIGKGNAGNITINASDNVGFDANSNATSGVSFDAIGEGGDIRVTTGTLSLTNGSQLSTNVVGLGNAGNIFVEARESITLDGINGNFISGIQSDLLTDAVGKGGDIQIATGLLSITDGAEISASIGGQGDAGNITINASDKVNISGFDTVSGLPSRVVTTVASRSVGNGGDIRINTAELLLKTGGSIETSNFGKGNAGSIFLNVGNTITFDGKGSDIFPITSNASTSVGNGDAGNIEINTGSLFLTNGGFMNAIGSPEENSNDIANAGNIKINARDSIKLDGEDSYLSTSLVRGMGEGGDIQITAGSFSLTDGAFLETSTSGQGNAGNIVLNVKDKITLSGTGQSFSGGLFAAASPESTGKGGSIFIDPRLVIIENGAGVSVASSGTGDAGDISLQADNLQLNNGFIAAITNTTQGGNINLQLGELLLLRNGSQISTTAGFAQAGGNGGNITIDSPFIVALPNENSDITANAFAGNGGNINITTQGIFGITPRSLLTPQSDITASSETGIQGTIDITNPEVDPNQGVIELPEGLVDKSNQIAQICPQGANAAKRLSEFYITGRGSLPPSPFKPLTGYINRTSLATLDEDTSIEEDKVIRSDRKIDFESKEIVEAQGFMKNADGEIYLVAQVPSSISSSNAVASACLF